MRPAPITAGGAAVPASGSGPACPGARKALYQHTVHLLADTAVAAVDQVVDGGAVGQCGLGEVAQHVVVAFVAAAEAAADGTGEGFAGEQEAVVGV
jgi:hypothetical protein